jgi:hypothetical protein
MVFRHNPATLARLKDQYFFFADRWVESVLLFQVGCYYEASTAGSKAWVPVLTWRAGSARIAVRAGAGAHGIPVALIRETDNRPWFGGVKPRELTVFWQPLPVEGLEMR